MKIKHENLGFYKKFHSEMMAICEKQRKMRDDPHLQVRKHNQERDGERKQVEENYTNV